MVTSRASEVLAALDPEQRQVAELLEGPMVVMAGAGTGKTRAITHRIAHAALTGVHDPNRTLAVTFTTRAAGELRARLASLGVTGVQARTFHSAALRQLQYFWPRVNRVDVPPVAQSVLSLVAEAAGRHRLRSETGLLRDLAGEVSWAKVSNVTPGEYPAIARATNRTIAGLDPATVARVLTSYESVKSEHGVIDFDDILLCTLALIHEHPDIAEEVRGRYRHLVVDEYQDVSPLQQNLLNAWLGDSGDICVVGDPHQSIHAFAGAKASYLTDFATERPDATVVHLVRDYRSTPQVVDLAVHVLKHGPHRMASSTLVAQQPDGPAVELVGAADDTAEARAIAAWLKQRHADGVPWREMAVLFRVRSQSPALEAELDDAGVPTLLRGTERFYERPEIRNALLRLDAEARNDPGQPAMAGVHGVLHGLGWTPTAPEGSGSVREKWESLQALAQLAQERVRDGASTLSEVHAHLRERAQLQHVPQTDAVTLSTIHSAKGLEWEAVAVCGVQEGTLPFVLASTPEQVEEERRLLYVAITRAKRHLRLSWARSGGAGRGGRGRSRFLNGVPGLGEESAPRTERSRRRRGTQLADRCSFCDRALKSALDRKLGHHLDCGDGPDEQVLARLKAWRKQRAEAESAPAFVIFTDATMLALAERRPRTEQELLAVPGIGRAKADAFGAELIALLGE